MKGKDKKDTGHIRVVENRIRTSQSNTITARHEYASHACVVHVATLYFA